MTRPVPVRAAHAALLLVLAATSACASRPADPADAAVFACRGTRYVDVRNTMRERVYVRITTTDNRTFFVDDRFAPGEVRRLGVPRGATVRRVDGSTEAWQQLPRGRVAPAEAVRQERGATARSFTSQLEMQMGCAE